MRKKYFFATLTGPSGIGKGYLKRNLKDCFDFEEPLVYTTRRKRKEDENNDRIFLSKKEFFKKKKNKEFIFVNKFYDNLYGFGLKAFNNINKKRIITEIHIDNVKEFRKKYLQANMILLLTDNINFLKYRLTKRGEDTQELNKRLKISKEELKKCKEIKNKFDFIYNVNYNNEDKIINEVKKYINKELKC